MRVGADLRRDDGFLELVARLAGRGGLNAVDALRFCGNRFLEDMLFDGKNRAHSKDLTAPSPQLYRDNIVITFDG